MLLHHDRRQFFLVTLAAAIGGLGGIPKPVLAQGGAVWGTEVYRLDSTLSFHSFGGRISSELYKSDLPLTSTSIALPSKLAWLILPFSAQ